MYVFKQKELKFRRLPLVLRICHMQCSGELFSKRRGWLSEESHLLQASGSQMPLAQFLPHLFTPGTSLPSQSRGIRAPDLQTCSSKDICSNMFKLSQAHVTSTPTGHGGGGTHSRPEAAATLQLRQFDCLFPRFYMNVSDSKTA